MSMLKKINAGRVESDEDFSIDIVGLELLKYKENGRLVTFGWTCSPKTNVMKIYVNDTNLWVLPASKEITFNEKTRIKENIEKAVKLLDGDFEII